MYVSMSKCVNKLLTPLARAGKLLGNEQQAVARGT